MSQLQNPNHHNKDKIQAYQEQVNPNQNFQQLKSDEVFQESFDNSVIVGWPTEQNKEKDENKQICKNKMITFLLIASIIVLSMISFYLLLNGSNKSQPVKSIEQTNKQKNNQSIQKEKMITNKVKQELTINQPISPKFIQETPKTPKTPKAPQISKSRVQFGFYTQSQSEYQQSQKKIFVPTLGHPQEGIIFNHTKVNDQDSYLFEQKMANLFKPYNDTNCEFSRFGDNMDGGYVMCKNFVSDAVALLNFGVEGRDNFGCDLTAFLKIPNYQYDCTNNYQPPCLKNNNNNVFQYTCLSNFAVQTSSKRYESLQSIIDKRGLKNKHIIIKIDIEAGEWPGFQSLPLEYLDYIDQIIMQVHHTGVLPPSFYRSQWGNLDILQNLMKYFVNVNFHVNNNACYPQQNNNHYLTANAFQVALVNKKLIKINSQTRSYEQNKANLPNSAFLRNCDMK